MTKAKEALKTLSVKFPVKDIPLLPENYSRFFRQAAYEKLERMKPSKEWKPKTDYGKKLWAMRKKYIRSGGEVLDGEGVSRELKERSGGLRD